MPEHKIDGTVCDFDFYVVNFNGSAAKLPTDTPDKHGMGLHEAIIEFKRQSAVNPPNYTTAIGVDFKVHSDKRDLNGGHSVGSIDFAHFKDGAVNMLDDYKQDKVIENEGMLRYNTYMAIKRETRDMEIKPVMPLYDKPLDYAREHDEIDKWRDNFHENIRCARALEKMVSDYHADNRLHLNVLINEAVTQFGEKRVELLLANTVQEKSWDGRFSRSNKEWAAAVNIPKDSHSNDICVNAHPALLDGVIDAFRKYLKTLEHDLADQQQEKNIAPERAESEETMEHTNGTKFEVSSMTKLEGEGATKALATLAINGEFTVSGIKVVEKKDGTGLAATMPSVRESNGEYKDVVFPVTKEAREAINNTVLATYADMLEKGKTEVKNDIQRPEKAVSNVYAQMHTVDSERTQTKAAGQITIDKCVVVTGVKLNEGTNQQGQTKTFVSMPSKMNEFGGYNEIAHPITAAFKTAMDKSVNASVNNIGRYEYKGVKYEELGANPAKSTPLHPKFADKLMAQLDKAGIAYQAKCAETVVISVKAEDKKAFDSVKKDLSAKLIERNNQERQTQTENRSTHNKTR